MDPTRRMSMARLVVMEAVLVMAFPAAACLAARRSSLPVPASFGDWWRADLVGVVAPVLWLAGFALSVWMLGTMLVYAWATRRGHAGLRRLVGAFTAPAVRRAVDAALVVSIGAAALVSPTRGFAAGSAAGPAPTPTSSATGPVVRSGVAPAGTTTTSVSATPAMVPDPTAPVGDTTTSPLAKAAPVVRAGGPRPPGGTAPPSLRTSPDLRPPTSSTGAAAARGSAPSRRTPTTVNPPTSTVTPVTPTRGPGEAERGSPARPIVRAVAPATAATGPTAATRNEPRRSPDVSRTPQAAPPTTASSAAALDRAVDPLPVAPLASPAPSAAITGTTAANHVVAAGESLWSIAAHHVREAAPDPAPTDADIARYWAAVVAANRAGLRSGEPSLVFPGEVVQLPPAR
jgi:hypothetical protein